MKLHDLQGKCTDIVCDNDSEFDAVTAILKSNGYELWDAPVKSSSRDMIRIFSDCSYAPHSSEYSGSVPDSIVITAKEFIEENS